MPIFFIEKISFKDSQWFFFSDSFKISKNSPLFRKIQHFLGSRALCQFVDVNPPASQSQYTHAQGMICDKLWTRNPLSEILTPLDRHCPTVTKGVKTHSLLSNCIQDLCTRDCTKYQTAFVCVCLRACVQFSACPASQEHVVY